MPCVAKPCACSARFFVKAVLPCDSASAGTPSRHSRTRVTPVAVRSGHLITLLPFSCERGLLVPLPQVREPNPRIGERKMKSEQIKEITDRATEQLVAALNAGRSDALTGYLKAIGRFHR